MTISVKYSNPNCPHCGDPRARDGAGHKLATCGAPACRKLMKAAQLKQRALWGSMNVQPGSVAAALTPTQRTEFNLWLKDRDRDLGSMERWARSVGAR